MKRWNDVRGTPPRSRHWLLALISFISLPRTSFTEQYASGSVTEMYWCSPRFKSINSQLTTMWAFVFLLMVPSHEAAGAINTHRAATFFNWVIPVALVVLAIKWQGGSRVRRACCAGQRRARCGSNRRVVRHASGGKVTGRRTDAGSDPASRPGPGRRAPTQRWRIHRFSSR